MQLLAFDYQNEQDLEGEDACSVLEGNCTDQILFDSYNAACSLTDDILHSLDDIQTVLDDENIALSDVDDKESSVELGIRGGG